MAWKDWIASRWVDLPLIAFRREDLGRAAPSEVVGLAGGSVFVQLASVDAGGQPRGSLEVDGLEPSALETRMCPTSISRSLTKPSVDRVTAWDCPLESSIRVT